VHTYTQQLSILGAAAEQTISSPPSSRYIIEGHAQAKSPFEQETKEEPPKATFGKMMTMLLVLIGCHGAKALFDKNIRLRSSRLNWIRRTGGSALGLWKGHRWRAQKLLSKKDSHTIPC
jgi:hypothetical protein